MTLMVKHYKYVETISSKNTLYIIRQTIDLMFNAMLLNIQLPHALFSILPLTVLYNAN